MRVKVLQPFKDKNNGKVYKKGDTLRVSKARFDEMLKVGAFVEEVKTQKGMSAK